MTLVRIPVQSNPDGAGPYIVAPMMREMGIGIRDLNTGKREDAGGWRSQVRSLALLHCRNEHADWVRCPHVLW